MIKELSLQDSNILKGLAILLMLIHHLFYVQNGLYNDIFMFVTKDGVNHYLVQEIGIFSKSCVAIFVFLSGYGLMLQTENKGLGSLKSFYFRRFKKLYLNYWLIWIIFVPITIFAFGYTFRDAYQNRIALNLLTDILGVHTLFIPNSDTYCYNPTWWFYSCIIVLYVLFPFVYKTLKNGQALTMILIAFAISMLPTQYIIGPIRVYILTYVLGAGIALWKIPPPRSGLLSIGMLLLFSLARNLSTNPIFIDCLVALSIVQIYRCYLVSIPNGIKCVFAFLGKHSMNIFLFHSFVFHFWFEDFVYFSRNPIVIFLTLLAICLPLSIVLEWIKKYTIYKL